MEAVIIPGKTLVHIGGVPVRLAVDTIVETAHDNMALLTGTRSVQGLDMPVENFPDGAIPVLDHGYILLVEHWGSDERIIESARMSTNKGFQGWGDSEHFEKCPNYGEKLVRRCDECERAPGDEKLLAYLWNHRHATPFEMAGMTIEVQAPIMVFREWHRHRTQCLAAGTQVIFSRPYNGSAYPYSIEKLADNFADPKERERLQRMNLRFRDATGEVRHTRITNAWYSGEKKVYRIETAHGVVVASADHRFLTEQGWFTVADLADKEVLFTRQVGVAATPVAPVFTVQELAAERWREVVDGYDVSDLGRVRSYWSPGQRAHRTKKTTPSLKTITTNSANRAVVGLPDGYGKTQAYQVSHLVIEAFVESRNGRQVLHDDDNTLNNRLQNLVFGNDKQNSRQRVTSGSQTRLRVTPERVMSIRDVGFSSTFDVEVEAPEHNFIANGFVTHNSYNEMSARYTPLPDVNYMPSVDRLLTGPTANKQAASLGEVLDMPRATLWLEALKEAYDRVQLVYQCGLDWGVPKELARLIVPVGRYSRMRASANLRNWLAFLTLRMDLTAQAEIRSYAAEVHRILHKEFPRTMTLFDESQYAK